MIGKNYQRIILFILLGGFVIGCAPKYSAHFQVKSHKMERYAQENKTSEENTLITSNEDVITHDEIVIKEIVTEPEQVQELLEEKSGEVDVIKPKTQKELFNALKNDPNATVAIDFNKLSKKEKRAVKKEVRDQLKEHKKVLGTQQYNNEPNKLLYYILAILLPPLAVGLWRGIGSDFWINILLTLLFYIPGLIHAIIVISSKPKATSSAY